MKNSAVKEIVIPAISLLLICYAYIVGKKNHHTKITKPC